MYDRYRRDRRSDRPHALVELIFDFVGTNNGPVGTVIEHLLIWLFRTRCGLKKWNNKNVKEEPSMTQKKEVSSGDRDPPPLKPYGEGT